jgi:hypothetical protein
MTVVKTAPAVVWNRKQEHPDMDEWQTVLRALTDVSASKILMDDLTLLIFSVMQTPFI